MWPLSVTVWKKKHKIRSDILDELGLPRNLSLKVFYIPDMSQLPRFTSCFKPQKSVIQQDLQSNWHSFYSITLRLFSQGGFLLTSRNQRFTYVNNSLCPLSAAELEICIVCFSSTSICKTKTTPVLSLSRNASLRCERTRNKAWRHSRYQKTPGLSLSTSVTQW